MIRFEDSQAEWNAVSRSIAKPPYNGTPAATQKTDIKKAYAEGFKDGQERMKERCLESARGFQELYQGLKEVEFPNLERWYSQLPIEEAKGD